MEEMQKIKIFKNAENDRQKVAATHPTKVCKIPYFFLNPSLMASPVKFYLELISQ